MKVCFISHSSARGGAELSLLELIDALRRRGMHARCILPSRGPLRTLLAERAVETEVVPFKQWVHSDPTAWGRLRRVLPSRHALGTVRLLAAIRRSRCDVVYTNTIATGVGALAAGLAGKPHVWHLREFGYDDHQLCYDFGRRVSAMLIARLSSACIANSRAVADAYRPRLSGTEVTVVYNSVEVSLPREDPPLRVRHGPWRKDGAIRCVLAGKFIAGKGQADAVQAMAWLRRMDVSAELVLLGSPIDPGYHRYVEQMIRENDLSARVHVLDHSDAPLPILESADIVLMCSRCEAFGRVTVEGMKLGKPVIGTRSGGTPEIVQDGETGFLYTPGAARELAARIAALGSDPQLRKSMAVKARQSARRRFNQENYGREVEAVLQRILAERRDRRARQPVPVSGPDGRRAA
jgi:glycosyltransferase involved in cell wall biosynthesis